MLLRSLVPSPGNLHQEQPSDRETKIMILLIKEKDLHGEEDRMKLIKEHGRLTPASS